VGAEDGGGIIEGRKHIGFGDKTFSFVSWSLFPDDVEGMEVF
jgi:hypothetical protein